MRPRMPANKSCAVLLYALLGSWALAQAQQLGVLPSVVLSCPTSLSPQCSNGLQLANKFVYGEVSGTASNTNPSQLSDACNACAAEWQTAFSGVVNASASWGTGCGGPNGTQSQAAMVTLSKATTQYVCYPGPDNTAGTCVNRISSGLRAAGTLNDVINMNPNLKFTGAVLQATCAALLPQGCCLRTWSTLMAAYAQQLCLPALAHEYLALPGRCAVLNPNAAVYDACIGNWTQSLLGALQPLGSAACGSWATDQGGSGFWAGSACSQQQLQANTCPSSSCDMYCNMAGTYRSLSAAAATSSSDDNTFSTWVIVFVSVVSGVIALMLLAALCACLVLRKRERQARMRASGRSYATDSAVAGSSMKSRAHDSFPRSMSGATAGSTTMQHTAPPEPRPPARMMRDIPVGALGVLLRGMGSSSQRPSISSLGGASGPTSMAVSSIVGRASMMGNSMVGNTITSITHEEGDEIAPEPAAAQTQSLDQGASVAKEREPKGVSESLQPLRREAPDASPVHYVNALYGNPLPPTPSPPATPSPSDTTPVAAAPVAPVVAAAAPAAWSGAAVPAPAPAPAPAAAPAPALVPLAAPLANNDSISKVVVHRSSRSFSFGVDGVSRLPPAHAVAEVSRMPPGYAVAEGHMAGSSRPALQPLAAPPAAASDSGWTAALVGPTRSPSGWLSPLQRGSSQTAMGGLPTGRWRSSFGADNAQAAAASGSSVYQSANATPTGSYYSATSTMPPGQQRSEPNSGNSENSAGIAFLTLPKRAAQ